MKKMTIGLLITGFNLWTTASFAQIIRGTYAIKNSQTNEVLRVQDARKANGTPIVSYSPVNWKCVTWEFSHIGGNAYQLRNLFTGKTLQPVTTTPMAGSNLEQQPLVTAQVNQTYEFIPAGKDRYKIRLTGTDLYITPSEAVGSINAKIILAKPTDSLLQNWTIYPQEPTM